MKTQDVGYLTLKSQAEAKVCGLGCRLRCRCHCCDERGMRAAGM